MFLIRIAVLVGLVGLATGSNPAGAQTMARFIAARDQADQLLRSQPSNMQQAVIVALIQEEDPVAARERIFPDIRTRSERLRFISGGSHTYLTYQAFIRSLRTMDSAVHEHLVALHLEMNPTWSGAREALITQAMEDFSSDWQDARIAYLTRTRLRQWYLMGVVPAIPAIRAGHSPFEQVPAVGDGQRPVVRMPRDLWINYLLTLMIGERANLAAPADMGGQGAVPATASGTAPASGRPTVSFALPANTIAVSPADSVPGAARSPEARALTAKEFLDLMKVARTMSHEEGGILSKVHRDLPGLLVSGKPEFEQVMDWFAIRSIEQIGRVSSVPIATIRAALNFFDAMVVERTESGAIDVRWTVRACTLRWAEKPLVLTQAVADQINQWLARERAARTQRGTGITEN